LRRGGPGRAVPGRYPDGRAGRRRAGPRTAPRYGRTGGYRLRLGPDGFGAGGVLTAVCSRVGVVGTERRRRRLRRGSPVSPEPDMQTPVADEPAAEAGGGRVARPPSPLDLADLGSAFAMTAGIQD